MSIATNITYLREQAQLDQKELAERLGTSTSAVRYFESGTKTPNVAVVLKMSEVLGCTPNDILMDRLTANPQNNPA